MIDRLHTPSFALCAVTLSLLAGAGAAHAEGSPYTVGAGITVGSDDNLFRAPRGQEVSDRYLTAAVFGSVDETIGRQRLQAGLTLRSSHFDRRSDLDNEGYGLQLAWNGATAGNISWTLSFDANRRLASYATVVDSDQRIANVETSRAALARVQLGLAAQWLAYATLSHRSIDYSAAAFTREEYRLDAVGVGAQWNPSGPLTLGVGPRFTRGRYPQGRVADDGSLVSEEFDRRDIDFTAKWVATGASTLSARVSLTRQRHDELSGRDFDGATSQLDWQWTATGRTRVHTVLSRDTGSETSFFETVATDPALRGSADNSRITNTIATRIDYDLTGKIVLNLAARYAERRLEASLAGNGAGAQSGSERIGSLGFGLRYTPTRNSLIVCDIAHHRRATRSSLSSPYRADTAACTARLAFN